MQLHDLDTPALCVDLDALDANIRVLSEFILSRGKLWRPHVQCHKSPEIALRQLRGGACGVAAGRLSDAEQFVAAGIADVLLAAPVVGEARLERLAALCGAARLLVACDHYAQAEAISAVCRRRGVRCRVLIAVNLGRNEVGVRPGLDALDLARGVDRLPGVALAGIMGHEDPQLRAPDLQTRRTRILASLGRLVELRAGMQQAGIRCEIVSAGSTGSCQISCEHSELTEVRAGGGILGDPFYADECGVSGLTPAVRLLARVISRPKLERAVLDFGRASLHPDVHPPRIERTAAGRPLPDVRFVQFGTEQATLELGRESQCLMIGEQALIVPGHTELTTPLHEFWHVLQEDEVVAVWPIAGRHR